MRRRAQSPLRTCSALVLLLGAGPAFGGAEAAPLRLRIELAAISIGKARLPIDVLLEQGEPGSTARPSRSTSSARVRALPQIDAKEDRFFLRDAVAEMQLLPASGEPAARAGTTEYHPTPSRSDARIARKDRGDAIEWTLAAEGLEHTLRSARPGSTRWRVTALRDAASDTTATVEHDAADRPVRIVVSDGAEWRLAYDSRPGDHPASARLVEISARAPLSVAGETLYRVRLEWSADDHLTRVQAASRAPAGVRELTFHYHEPEAQDASPRGATLREIRTPRGEVEPRFEYDDRGVRTVLSAIPDQDAYDTRYRVTARLAPEYVGEDLLADSLGRNTLAFGATDRRRYRLRTEQGRLLRDDGTPFDTEGEAFLIVLAPDGELYAGRGDYSSATKLHHSSFLAGDPVAAAGEVVASAGRPTRITARSGHYKPPLCLLDQLRAELERRGIDLRGVPFEKGY